MDFNSFILDAKELISIKSVVDEKQDDAPFGLGVKNALLCFLNIADKMGFKTINYDNYIGEVVYGEGEEIGIIGHVDVVPEGSGWKTNPFELSLLNGVYYGRGILDDKLPLLACLYALKDLKDSKVKVNKKFRLFIGCDEETGWRDAEYLKTVSNFPEYGFSPDGNFPVGYAEKEMCIFEFPFNKLKNFCEFNGGTVINAVCGYASIKSNIEINQKLIKKYRLKANGNKIESFGLSAHGSTPEKGKNAILPILKYLKDMGEDVKDIIDYLFLDKGKISKNKCEQGKITFSPDIVKSDKKGFKILADCRIPAPFSEKEVIKIFDKTTLTYSYSVKHPTMMVDKNGEFVNKMLNSYNTVMKKKEKPVSQGGSTFARVFLKGCAFGPEFPDKKSTIHEPNECVSKEDLLKICDIYNKTIFSLAK